VHRVSARGQDSLGLNLQIQKYEGRKNQSNRPERRGGGRTLPRPSYSVCDRLTLSFKLPTLSVFPSKPGKRRGERGKRKEVPCCWRAPAAAATVLAGYQKREKRGVTVIWAKSQEVSAYSSQPYLSGAIRSPQNGEEGRGTEGEAGSGFTGGRNAVNLGFPRLYRHRLL